MFGCRQDVSGVGNQSIKLQIGRGSCVLVEWIGFAGCIGTLLTEDERREMKKLDGGQCAISLLLNVLTSHRISSHPSHIIDIYTQTDVNLH